MLVDMVHACLGQNPDAKPGVNKCEDSRGFVHFGALNVKFKGESGVRKGFFYTALSMKGTKTRPTKKIAVRVGFAINATLSPAHKHHLVP